MTSGMRNDSRLFCILSGEEPSDYLLRDCYCVSCNFSCNTIPPSNMWNNSGGVQMKSRELLVEERMHAKQLEYVKIRPFRFYLTTWNVNGKFPNPNEPLEIWLTKSEKPPHCYVIGFQELDLDTMTYLGGTSVKEAAWQKAVEAALLKEGKYTCVRNIRLVGMMLLIYISDKHKSKVRNVSASAVGTGIMNRIGNKGGVGIRMDFHDSQLCFISAHFAAHTEEVERRNEDFRNICDRMVFTELEFPKRIRDHDIIMWVGDFNYRISKLNRQQVEEMLNTGSVSDLVDFDQLQQQMQMQRVFEGFKEGKIKFKPSYKYDIGTDVWDTSEKSRVPSWCDRILWKTRNGEQVRLVEYTDVKEMRVSDHKPVIAMFDVGIKVIDESKRKTIYEQVLKEIDREENSFIPQATVDKYDFDMGSLTFIEPVTRTLTVANTGQVPVIFEFIPKPGTSSYCKDWMKVTPERDIIIQGEVKYIDLQVYVDKKTAAALTTGQELLNDILVLHLQGGKDFFISVQGRYMPSCFGTSLEALIGSKLPIRPLSNPSEELIQFNSPSAPVTVSAMDHHPPPDGIPIEVWMMIVHLYSASADIPDLFLQPGPPDQVEKIRDHLDARLPLPLPGSGHSVAEALLLFFDALPEPLVPNSFYALCLEASQSQWPTCFIVLEKFPKVHRETFKAFIVLLRELQRHWKEHPSSDVGTLEVIADLILRSPSETVTPATAGGVMARAAQKEMQRRLNTRKTTFLQQFLSNKMDAEPVIPKTIHTFPVVF